MSWSAEELVKQLRYPPAYMDSSATALMRVAADMIDRLRAELAEAYRAYALDADEVRLELHNAEAAIARVRELCNRAVFTRQHMLPESTVRDAIERNEK